MLNKINFIIPSSTLMMVILVQALKDLDFKSYTDIEKDKVSIIITKDLSRLGRDYLKTGYYIENYFPEHKVRFIAVNDSVDSNKDN